MPALTRQQIVEFSSRGYVSPIRVLSEAEAQQLRADLDALETSIGPDIWERSKVKPHLLIKRLNELIRDTRIVDAVEGLLGHDLLVWGIGRFAKKARDPAFVSFHQDATYWDLSEPAVVTAWVALTPSIAANGCLQVLPGSHLMEQLPHRDTFRKDNMLSRGQEVAVAVDPDRLVKLELQPGEMSLHHTMLVHGSEPNQSDIPRIGFAIRYIAARVSHGPGFRDSATLVRGADTHGHYVLEPEPSGDFDPRCQAVYDEFVGEHQRRKIALALRNVQ